MKPKRNRRLCGLAHYLVIVESPAKAKTINRFLGKNYTVVASNGHVRDLPKSQLGIDVDNDFEPKYITIRGKGEILAKLRPIVKPDGTVTAGNACGLNDGAAALVIMSADKAKELGLKPMAKILSYASAGVDPAIMGIGPVPASRKALGKVNLKVEDMDLIEANEAFAAQFVEVGRELNFDPEKVNVNGGAIALGHPIGASGARILVTLLYALKHRNKKLGLATLCIGGGMGTATVIEML